MNSETPIYDALVAELNLNPHPVKLPIIMTTPKVGAKPTRPRKKAPAK